MNHDLKIWNLARFRFLQAEASLWIFGNKILDALFIVSLGAWIYFEFLSYSPLKYFGLVVAVISFAAAIHRVGRYRGFFDGYEQGFRDAATRNLDYWGNSHSESSDRADIEATIRDIEKNEEQLSPESKASREAETKAGLGKFVGLVFTRRRLE